MFGTLPGNPQRAEAVSKLLDVEVFAAQDGSSHLCVVLDKAAVDDFLSQAGKRLTGFELVERQPMVEDSRVVVQFACKDALELLVF